MTPQIVPIDALSLRSPIEIVQGEGRGIVIPAGGIYLRSAWVTVRMIRHFGCDLPIELWTLPWESVTDRERKYFELFGVTIRTADAGYCLNESFRSERWQMNVYLAGWQLKVQSVLQSRFCEVLFLDADCYPIKKDWEAIITETAGTFLGDVTSSDRLYTREACQWGGVEHDTPVDSGAFFVNKIDSRWLEIVAALNGPELVRDTYNQFYGDKDTWTVARQLAGDRSKILDRGTLLPKAAGIVHPCGLLHRTGSKFTDGSPANTPQHGDHRLDGDELTAQFLRSWPPLEVRSERDFELIRGVIELDEYRVREIHPQKWVVDAGAHVGSFSATVRKLWPSSNVMAFEPSQDNATIFSRNVTDVPIAVMALGDASGRVSLRSAIVGDTAFTTCPGDEISVVRLSGMLNAANWPRVDLLKIDIEGDEEQVFCELAESGWIKRVSRIVGEWHDFPRLCRIMEVLRETHHLTVCCHWWEHGYFEAVRNDVSG